MTKALDAAIRAAQEAVQHDYHRRCFRGSEPCPVATPCGCMSDATLAALRAALPAEPSREIVETMARALWGGEGERFKAMLWEAYCEGARSAYLALRVHLLGEAA